VPSAIQNSFAQYGSRYGVPPALLRTVARLESNINPNAPRGGAGEIGMFQLMPDTARRLGVDASNPDDNIRGAAKLLGHLMERYKGDISSVLAAYNEGEPAFERRRKRGQAPPATTRNYVRNGMQLMGLS
jgi:soluble lytic murein transglycosylase-like protein